MISEQLQSKRLAFLDILKVNTDEQFDLDFALMTGEVAKLLVDVVEALGGEKAKAI
jgi:recombination associated protein RdgC